MTSDSVRFQFGENWASYSQLIDDTRIEQARQGLLAFFKPEDLKGVSFLDIGCGSGLHSLSALMLGVGRLVAFDYDTNSVSTTQALLQARQPGGSWQVSQGDVLKLTPEALGQFDVVYSWGVLHHTGHMVEAIQNAARFVKPGGKFMIAIYGKTPFCGFWKIEKRWYSKRGPLARKVAHFVYKLVLGMRLALRGQTLGAYRKWYFVQRGMELEHDIADWMGGYPYESATPKTITDLVEDLGFKTLKVQAVKSIGLLGTGCDEFLFQRA